MAVAVVPFMAAIVGLLLWVLASSPKLAEAGKIIFFCAVLVLMSSFAGKTIRIG